MALRLIWVRYKPGLSLQFVFGYFPIHFQYSPDILRFLQALSQFLHKLLSLQQFQDPHPFQRCLQEFGHPQSDVYLFDPNSFPDDKCSNFLDNFIHSDFSLVSGFALTNARPAFSSARNTARLSPFTSLTSQICPAYVC